MEKPLEKISTGDLSSMVSEMPWFAAARVELCRRTSGKDPSQYYETAPHVFSREILYDMANDPMRAVPSPVMGEENKKKVHVAGGDFFSQDEYDNVEETKISFNLSSSPEEDTCSVREENVGEIDFCTESLAGIFAQQGYFDEAIKIYSQLSLRYPEKSAYFATLIENTKNLERN